MQQNLTIALKQEQSLNLNSQNILSNTKKIETDNIDSKEDIITPKASKKNEQKQSIFSKLLFYHSFTDNKSKI